jgi:hypothetical protein
MEGACGGGGGNVQLIKKVKASEHVYSGNFLQKFEFFLHIVLGASHHIDFSCQKLGTFFARTKNFEIVEKPAEIDSLNWLASPLVRALYPDQENKIRVPDGIDLMRKMKVENP